MPATGVAMSTPNMQGDLSVDKRPLALPEMLAALQDKFAKNFASSIPLQAEATAAEHAASSIWRIGHHLKPLAAEYEHQRELVSYLDEIFGDAVCALYLSCCGLTVASRTVLRRSLELGLVVVSYWDSPSDFWQWRAHDGDIRFSTLLAHLQSDGYKTFLARIPRPQAVDVSALTIGVEKLYSELSNVVHPKPYNFATRERAAGYAFDSTEFRKTAALGQEVFTCLQKLLEARFPSTN
jgi:hypothetical protein